jgi:hypothetical protein
MKAIRLAAALPLLAVLSIPAFAAPDDAASAKYQQGVAVFTVAIGGLMYEASVGGQKFGFTPFGAKKK